MLKGTTIKDAIAKFEEKEGCKAGEQKVVKMYCQIPSIEKMDASLSTLVQCTQLSLSSNQIEKIANLNGLKNLQILSLGRNMIKSFTGLEAVGETLVELWISYNRIEKLKGINVLKKLQVLFMCNNEVKDKNEFEKLADLPCLKDLVFVGNPLEDEITQSQGSLQGYRDWVGKRLPKLMKLDGMALIREVPKEDD